MGTAPKAYYPVDDKFAYTSSLGHNVPIRIHERVQGARTRRVSPGARSVHQVLHQRRREHSLQLLVQQLRRSGRGLHEVCEVAGAQRFQATIGWNTVLIHQTKDAVDLLRTIGRPRIGQAAQDHARS